MEIRAIVPPDAARRAPGFDEIVTSLGDHAVEAAFQGLWKVAVTADGMITLHQRHTSAYSIPHGDLVYAADPAGLELAVRTLGMAVEDRPEQATDWSRRGDGTLDLAFRDVVEASIETDDELRLSFTDGESATVGGLARFTRIATASSQSTRDTTV